MVLQGLALFFSIGFLQDLTLIFSPNILLAALVQTLISVKGKAYADHARIATAWKAAFFFAHLYASWERGLNENTNGLVRQYFTKAHRFTTITKQEVKVATHKLNPRPRKCLGFQTPSEVFYNSPAIALTS